MQETTPIKPAPSTAYLHVLRVTAAIFVILLHCVAPFYNDLAYFETRAWWISSVLNEITRTAVPMFFMMSGYLLLSSPKTREIGAFYRKRLPRLVIPLLVWNGIYYLYYARGDLHLTAFLKQILVEGTAYHLWFVYSMIAFYLFLPYLKRIVDACTERQMFGLFVLLAFPGTIRPFFNTVTPVYMQFFDTLTNGYIPYFLLGYLLGHASLSRIQRLCIYGGGIAGLALGIFWNWYYSSPAGLSLIANEAYRINHMLCAAAVFVLFRQLPWERCAVLTRFAAAWSKRTFGVYFIHVLVLELCTGYIPLPFSPMLVILCRFVLTTVISFVVIRLVDLVKPLARVLM